ncbi:sphingomyelin phosphodiesterase [Nocardiopsis terrae]|uniref:Sphingomyelin phosphodiesterase n=1 Tax=Nocardiopsis terrae TaxID=372655 RepID=A0ABR9HJY0_9ACTN|nr:sphingomyelin phosphodiesterase [Nocardiopsis terrae]MBE1459317.1 sphingomyelin phosphodiesterase [Nocardiopsis terrae]GHC89250.1 sphingomyelin phosphodiesterase [Nocardiopsis terrae]
MYRRTTAALLTTLLITPLLSATPAFADSAPASQPAPRIATHNTFLMPKALYPNWGQDIRADLIADDGVLSGQDVVVLQELFENSSAGRLREGLAEEYPHATPVLGRSESGWDRTTGFRHETVTNGGVSVHSVWPIVRSEQHVFTSSCGADWFSNKGFAYVELDTPDGPLHVVGTHMQSEDGSCGDGEDEQVRGQQLDQIRSVLEEKEVLDTEPVYLAGDLNIVGGGQEWDRALEQLGAVEPVSANDTASWDTGTNSIAAEEYPDWAPEQLDHVLPIGDASPQTYVNETRPVKSEPWTVRSWGREYTYDDYSDHYPVFGSADLP